MQKVILNAIINKKYGLVSYIQDVFSPSKWYYQTVQKNNLQGLVNYEQ